jgi:hypothetical protein
MNLQIGSGGRRPSAEYVFCEEGWQKSEVHASSKTRSKVRAAVCTQSLHRAFAVKVDKVGGGGDGGGWLSEGMNEWTARVQQKSEAEHCLGVNGGCGGSVRDEAQGKRGLR